MPESIIHRTFGGGFSLVRGPNGASIFQTTGGAPGGCCCGGCPFYYMAKLCNPTCIESADHIYICSTSTCSQGGYQGQVQPGKIVRLGDRCYRVQSTRYCPPLTEPHGAGCVPMPTRAPIYEQIPDCEHDCLQPPNGPCPRLTGWYRANFCSNTPATGPDRYVCCEAYEEALQIYPCPVWGSGDRCVYVASGSTPVEEPPPGSILICSAANVHRNCCACSGFAVPGCCRCTQPSVLNLYRDCGINTTVGGPVCESWPDSAGLVVYGGILTEQLNFGRTCPVSLTCLQPDGHNRTRITTYQFTGDCEPGNTYTCQGSCPLSASGQLFGPPSVDWITYPECATGFGAVYAIVGGGNPPCCAIGQELATCRTYQLDHVSDNMPCGGQRTTTCIRGNVLSAPGQCGDDNCGGSLRLRENPIVLLDGTPASEAMKIVGGCSNCGGDKGELV